MPLTPFQWREHQKEVLFSTDLDHTLLGWLSDDDDKIDEPALAATNQVIQHHRKDMAVHFNTGRGLAAIQAIAPFLKGIPVDYLSVNNGQELYINRRQKEASDWIKNLEPSDASRLTRRLMRQSQWDTPRAMTILTDILNREGFVLDTAANTNLQYEGVTRLTKNINGQKVLVEFFPDQSSLYVEPSLYIDGKSYGESLAAQWEKELGQAGLHAEFSQMYAGSTPENAHHVIFMAFPHGVNKASAIDSLIQKRLPNLRGVVTAGDSATNDYDFVAPKTFGILPNFPIISGLKSKLLAKLEGHPRMEVTDTGKLALPLEQQIGKILNLSA